MRAYPRQLRGGRRGLTLMLFLLAVLASLALCAWEFRICLNIQESEALRLVEGRGYVEPKTIDWSALGISRLGCQDGDDFGFIIEADIDDGRRVRLNVCCGSSFRGCRFVLAPSEMRDSH